MLIIMPMPCRYYKTQKCVNMQCGRYLYLCNAIQFVPEWYKTQKMYNQDVDICTFAF